MKSIILFVIVAILMSSLAIATGIEAGTLSPRIDFVPGATYTFHYTARPNTGYLNDYSITAKGPFSEYVTLSEKYLKNTSTAKPFTATLTFPDDYEPGLYPLFFCVKEAKCKDGGGACGKTAACAGPKIRVLYEGIYPKVNLGVPNINENETLKISLMIENWGKADIKESNQFVEIFDDDDKNMGKVIFSPVSIKTAGEARLQEEFDTTGIKPGVYTASVHLDADGVIKTDSKLFMIGTLDVEIVNYSKKVLVGGIKKFKFYAKSKWNLDAKDAYATLTLSKDGNTVATARSSSYDIPKWSAVPMEAFLDLTNAEPGEYDVEILLHYEGHKSLKKGKVLLESESGPIEEKPINMTMILLVIIVVALTLINAYLFMRKKNDSKKET